MSKPYLLTDVDGVLLDWLGPFLSYVDKRKDRKEGVEHMDFFALQKLYHNATQEELDNFVREFNDSSEFGELNSISNADVYLPIVAEHYKIVAITASNTNAQSTQMREDNLKRIFGDVISDVFYVERKQSKEEILGKFPSSYWVEDFFPNAIAGFKVGHNPIIIKRPYNSAHRWENCVHWVNDWKEIKEYINGK